MRHRDTSHLFLVRYRIRLLSIRCVIRTRLLFFRCVIRTRLLSLRYVIGKPLLSFRCVIMLRLLSLKVRHHNTSSYPLIIIRTSLLSFGCVMFNQLSRTQRQVHELYTGSCLLLFSYKIILIITKKY